MEKKKNVSENDGGTSAPPPLVSRVYGSETSQFIYTV